MLELKSYTLYSLYPSLQLVSVTLNWAFSLIHFHLFIQRITIMNYAALSSIVSGIEISTINGSNGPVFKVEASVYTLYTRNEIEQAGWIKVVVYGQMAEQFAQLPEGAAVLIEGPLTVFKYTSPAGTTSQYPLVNLYRFQLLPDYFQFSMVSLEGRLGADPRAVALESGSTISSSILAVDGTKKDETHWFNIEAWNQIAEALNQYTMKGKQISISGLFRFDSYVKTDTNELAMTFMVCINQLTLGATPRLTDDYTHEDAVEVNYTTGSQVPDNTCEHYGRIEADTIAIEENTLSSQYSKTQGQSTSKLQDNDRKDMLVRGGLMMAGSFLLMGPAGPATLAVLGLGAWNEHMKHQID